MAIKTLTFWVLDMTSAERKLLDDVRSKLGDAQRAMVSEWLRLAMNEEAYPENAGKRKGREVFAETEYSNDIVNNFAHADAHARFKQQWKKIRRGERSSVSFSGNAAYVYFASTTQITVKERDGDWWISAPRIFAGKTKAVREHNAGYEWRLKPVSKRSHWELELMARATKVSCVRLMPDKKKSWKYVAKVTIELPNAERVKVERDITAGIDLGLNCPLVLSIPDKGIVRFMGREKESYPLLWAKLKEYEKRKMVLNRAGKHRAARNLRTNITGVRQHINECISRQVVDLCRAVGVTILRMEDLKGITRGKAASGRMSHWPRFHLMTRIKEKCAEVGIEFALVKPSYTSTTCSVCGHNVKENRNGAAFKCVSCGFERHADVNAANNIARNMETFGLCESMSAQDDTVELRFDGGGQEPAQRKAKRLIV